MDALVAYGSGSEGSDNNEGQKQSSNREEGDIREIPVSITSMDLPPSSRVPLPLELNCEIFKCLKLPVQRKFIWGLGRDIYGMFGQKLLKKTKRVRNPHGNRWNGTNTRATITADGLHVCKNTVGNSNVFAVQPFPTSGPQCRVDGFPGTICYYYEVKGASRSVGLSDVAIADNSWIGHCSNSYAITIDHYWYECWIAGERHHFELPEGAIQTRWKRGINVFGCGLVIDSGDKLWIFFTMNGQLLGQKIPSSPTVDRLSPTVGLYIYAAIEANFGGDPAKPFEYDIQKCPDLGLACI